MVRMIATVSGHRQEEAMGIRDRYEHGVFSWVDLATSDQDAAKSFYSQLLGWRFEDMPMEGTRPYSMAYKGDRKVAAIFTMMEEMQTQQIPAHWQSYINVENIDTATQACSKAGGIVEFGPYSVLDSGRMAVIQDPTGVSVNLWEAGQHIGAGLVNEVNTFCWAELQTRGSEKAVQFYQSVFNWEIEIDKKPPFYVMGKVNGKRNCGIFDMDKIQMPAEIPSKWAVYFHIENLDTAMAMVKDLGGKVMMDPVKIDPGRFTTIIDPQGAVVTLIELAEVDD